MPNKTSARQLLSMAFALNGLDESSRAFTFGRAVDAKGNAVDRLASFRLVEVSATAGLRASDLPDFSVGPVAFFPVGSTPEATAKLTADLDGPLKFPLPVAPGMAYVVCVTDDRDRVHATMFLAVEGCS
jgi:hypothetical protein